ncbi:MAG: amidase [Candidatus Rokuibacteriota bacterium]|nr:MAG: amidase [Candidatus Rokubacteria bacterium]
MPNDELCFTSAVDLAAAIRARRLSPVEVTTAVLARIDKINPVVNAYCTVVADRALDEARRAEAAVAKGERLGPLHGVPISFKDLTPTAGIRTTFGSKAFEHNVPNEDALVVERARAAGAVVIGKTNTPEFGCKGATDNLIFGHTRNPWNRDRVAGGSSGGAAAAVAAGLAPIAEGSDLAGSIRIPASACGVVGFKPSLGRIPRWPMINGYTGMSHLGPITRTVRDAALLMTVWAGPDERDPQSLPATGEDFGRAIDTGVKGLRAALSLDLGFAAVDQEVRRIVAAAAKSLTGLGVSVDEAHPGFDGGVEALFMDLTAPIRAAAMAPLLPTWREQMDPMLLLRLDRATTMTAVDSEQATHRRTALWQTVRRFFERYDLLLTPTLATAAFPIGRVYPDEIDGRPVTNGLQWFPFTYPFNLTGQPAITVPCGFTSDGLPVGLQIVGRRYADLTVLRAARAFELASPWTERRPEL